MRLNAPEQDRQPSYSPEGRMASPRSTPAAPKYFKLAKGSTDHCQGLPVKNAMPSFKPGPQTDITWPTFPLPSSVVNPHHHHDG